MTLVSLRAHKGVALKDRRCVYLVLQAMSASIDRGFVNEMEYGAPFVRDGLDTKNQSPNPVD